MEEGAYPSMSALARAEGVTPAAVSKALIRLRVRDRDAATITRREVVAK